MFRIQQGISTKITTLTEIGGNDEDFIESYINNAYNNWTIPPVAVLLLGDYGTDAGTIISPVYDDYCISDNTLGDPILFPFPGRKYLFHIAHYPYPDRLYRYYLYR